MSMNPRKGRRRLIRPAENFGRLGHLDSLLYLPDLAKHVYGDHAKGLDSSLTAFAYCYRRFGPPPWGTDGRKNLGGEWILTTRDPEVFLGVDPGGCSIDYYLHYYVSERLRDEADGPGLEWRREAARRRFDAENPGKSYEDFMLAQIEDEPCPFLVPIVEQSPGGPQKLRHLLAWPDDMPPYPRRCSAEIEARVECAVTYALRDLLRPCYVRDVAINLFGRISEKNLARGQVARRSPLAGWGVREIERRAQLVAKGEAAGLTPASRALRLGS